MRILVLGGTLFVGRWIVTRLVEAGHDVTLLNRGRSAPDVFPDLELLRCERGREDTRLVGRRFDLVIDSAAYLASDIATVLGLPQLAERYLLLSSVAVYESCSPGMAEDGPLLEAASEGPLTAVSLGAGKRACERKLTDVYGQRGVILRCGLLVGPHDVSSSVAARPLDFDQLSPRFPYWPLRVWDGGRILIPARRHCPLQILDVRDLADWVCRLAEGGGAGTYNAVGAASTLGALFDACRSPETWYVEVEDWFLLDNAVLPFVELPFWIPVGAPRTVDYGISNAKALAAGLTIRSLADTVSATLDWVRDNRDRALPASAPVLTRERERQLLEGWDQASKSESWVKLF
ncbi:MULTISPECIES: NAD-dependent epimerase/dehydratase family protein [unclassified Bradyrhizobium]|uniref:NAD-dependent epimerase/dehydratase family protein n=1 Tax=unclassified Bradyrhizobium TaxID=2631580 RepID=UPI002916539C|nr:MULTISPECIES: NAD-dependent epimerase/dehydratase family protein [unclassified Bradyrhizobium]